MSSLLWKAREMARLKYEAAKADISGKISVWEDERVWEEQAAITKAVNEEKRKLKIKKAVLKVRSNFEDGLGTKKDIFR